MHKYNRVGVVDSHTGGEPTRVVMDGMPDLGHGSMADRCRRFSAMNAWREAVVCEPRGSDILVGALLVPPSDPSCTVGVIFFNNVGTLGMCGHGAIGVIITLQHLGRITPGVVTLETPVGIVRATLHDDGRVTIANVPSYRETPNLSVIVPGLGSVTGDVAWGGNWFFLTHLPGESLERTNVERLTDVAWRIRQCLDPKIDHVELYGPPHDLRNSGRNFVLCPGKAYDRSPCGTGTSAKIARLAADGQLQPGQLWRQESVTDSVFEATFQWNNGQIIPSITGRASIIAEATLLLET